MAENEPLRRSLRLALIEVSFNGTANEETPSKSPDEMVIVQRGPRCKPLTWSPVDYQGLRNTEGTPNETTVEVGKKGPHLNSRIRRRLVMSPGKTSQELGEVIAKKLKTLPKYRETLT